MQQISKEGKLTLQSTKGYFPKKIRHDQRIAVRDNFAPVYGHRQCLL